MHYFKKYLLGLRIQQKAQFGLLNLRQAFNASNTKKKENMDSRFYPLPVETVIKDRKFYRTFGAFSDNDIDLLDDDLLKIDTTAPSRNKIFGVGFAAGYKSDSEIASYREAERIEKFVAPYRCNDRDGFRFQTGRYEIDSSDEDHVLIRENQGKSPLGGSFSNLQYGSDLSDEEEQLLLNPDDRILRTRHPVAVFAKPVILKKPKVDNRDHNYYTKCAVQSAFDFRLADGRKNDYLSDEEMAILSSAELSRKQKGVCSLLVQICMRGKISIQ